MHVAGRGISLFAVAVTAVREKVNDLPSPRVSRLRLPDLRLSATIGRGHRRRRSAHQLVMTWWASHALEAVVWTLAMALAVGAGLVVAWF
jgi:hypothetical protein